MQRLYEELFWWVPFLFRKVLIFLRASHFFDSLRSGCPTENYALLSMADDVCNMKGPPILLLLGSGHTLLSCIVVNMTTLFLFMPIYEQWLYLFYSSVDHAILCGGRLIIHSIAP